MQLDPALLLLDGAWVPGPGSTLEVRDPRDDALVGRIPLAGPAEGEAAVGGAAKAAAGWARTSAGGPLGALKAAARSLAGRGGRDRRAVRPRGRQAAR
jgi:acyl-CoA reductase-like NAD-dependent aldehyde dehydrogenase